MARPKLAVKRTHQVHFRCTALEKKAIQKQAEHSGLQVAEYVRAAALNVKISFKLTEGEVAAYKVLTEYRNNFTHLGNLVRNRQDFAQEIHEVVKLIDQHLKKII